MSTSSKYRQTLSSISARTGTPLPSLIVSFGILHEITAIAPLVGIFYGAKALGLGEQLVTAVIKDTPEDSDTSTALAWMKFKGKEWIKEGENRVERVGRRYGWFGYGKRVPGQGDESTARPYAPGHIAGDVANAVVAYGATKALLPLRIGLSLYLSPAFSRAVVEPVRRFIVRPFKRS
ncbi:hypothetical protein Moror_17758 [Moniliophthora roreri MCA 2997]|uniref:Uncharacterized protein n=2 Tax=Moniliophthora roreri TaxID=221103 RepID=V2XU81_MONRO|nr:hypothetical protein Moror_17758 [Moniliophthora roreri MCA 2997]KAI3619057.1 hypothetical protein WG66_000495 [Moniliophthora roreri]